MSGAAEVKAGMRVRFLHDGPDLHDGIVNGEPWVFFDGGSAGARIPVFSPALGRTIDVGGGNIYSVGETVADLREAFPAHSGRV